MAKTVITLTRLYEKTVQIEIPSKFTEGKTKEEIRGFLHNNMDWQYELEGKIEKEFEQAEFEFQADCPGNRYDIYDKNEQHIYGGHL